LLCIVEVIVLRVLKVRTLNGCDGKLNHLAMAYSFSNILVPKLLESDNYC